MLAAGQVVMLAVLAFALHAFWPALVAGLLFVASTVASFANWRRVESEPFEEGAGWRRGAVFVAFAFSVVFAVAFLGVALVFCFGSSATGGLPSGAEWLVRVPLVAAVLFAMLAVWILAFSMRFPDDGCS